VEFKVLAVDRRRLHESLLRVDVTKRRVAMAFAPGQFFRGCWELV